MVNFSFLSKVRKEVFCNEEDLPLLWNSKPMIKLGFSNFVFSLHSVLGIVLGSMQRALCPPSKDSQSRIGTR